MTEKNSIALCARRCLAVFKRLLGVLNASQTEDEVSSEVVATQLGRFELWARNIAALQDAHLPSSLEHRIRDDEGARGVVTTSLEYLEESLDMSGLTVHVDSTG